MNISKTKLGLALMLAFGSVAAGLNAAKSSPFPGDTVFHLEIKDKSGALYDGEVNLYVRQAYTAPGLPDTAARMRTWGPIDSYVSSGLVTYTAKLNGFDHGSKGILEVWPDDQGQTNVRKRFFVDPEDGAHGEGTFSTSAQDPNGEHHVVLRDLRIIPAPVYGKVTLSSTGASGFVDVTFAKQFTHKSTPNLTETFVADIGVPFSIYSWLTQSKVQFYADTQSGWGVPVTDLFRGSSVLANLDHEGSVACSYNANTHEVFTSLLFPAASYQPFVVQPGDDHDLARISILARRSGIRQGLHPQSLPGNGTFSDIPAGNYVLEFWTNQSLDASPPGPAYSVAVSVSGGQTTSIQIP